MPMLPHLNLQPAKGLGLPFQRSLHNALDDGGQRTLKSSRKKRVMQPRAVATATAERRRHGREHTCHRRARLTRNARRRAGATKSDKKGNQRTSVSKVPWKPYFPSLEPRLPLQCAGRDTGRPRQHANSAKPGRWVGRRDQCAEAPRYNEGTRARVLGNGSAGGTTHVPTRASTSHKVERATERRVEQVQKAMRRHGRTARREAEHGGACRAPGAVAPTRWTRGVRHTSRAARSERAQPTAQKRGTANEGLRICSVEQEPGSSTSWAAY